ncbi:hypothetical protein GWI33_020811 [Rhynchophorus ferrugineus]|uniref:Uncharacterized protein n=1 Tax=Rhynchophorus ferrugineus TaxID=354439 RepID=A0A834HQS8_RHYFE|nr:hypothetical protein GWI33_020811 [Rhynchophorus ferrugineus]
MSLGKIGHFLIAAHFWFGCYYDWNYVKIPIEIHDMGDSSFNSKKLKFLTYWDALLQSTFFTICFLNDIFGTNEKYPKSTPFFRKLKDLLLPALAFPLAMFVGVTFWGLYFIDRELIFPRSIDPYFPWWLNHLMHTNIMFFIILELFTSYRKYPSRKLGLSILTLFMLLFKTIAEETIKIWVVCTTKLGIVLICDIRIYLRSFWCFVFIRLFNIIDIELVVLLYSGL